MSYQAQHFLLEVQLLRDRVPSFEHYPFALPAIRSFERLTPHPAVTFIVGENGTGKSTLLEGIAVAWGLNAEGGTRNFNFATRASHSELHRCLRLSKSVRRRPYNEFFLRAESFFNLATNIEQLDREPGGPPIIASYGGRSLHEMSHGESFMALLMNRLGGDGIYFFDEPEAALSPNRQLAMLARMHQLVREGSQFIIATHSPILMAYPNASIFLIDENGLRQVDYRETEHFRVTRNFLLDPDRMLAILLADEDPEEVEDREEE